MELRRNFSGAGDASALLRCLCYEATELRHDLCALALGAFHLGFLPFRERHDQFEKFVALLAHELIARHSTSLVSFVTVMRDAVFTVMQD
jgi:hypothetical protein